MALLDRFNPTAQNRLAVHDFGAAMHLVHDGIITKAQLVQYFQLSAQEEAQLDLLVAVYVTKPNAAAKLSYIVRVQSVLVLFESGKIDQSTVAQFLELS
ncbi:MAG: hypothetical protein HC828_08735 [Blastochloris sp.]|nr:hypothetical protein [Blastochloris sp.]